MQGEFGDNHTICSSATISYVKSESVKKSKQAQRICFDCEKEFYSNRNLNRHTYH